MSWVNAGWVALWVAAVVQTMFVVLYGVGPWWRHFVGRALFTKSLALCLVLWLTVVNYYLTYPGQLQVTVCATWLVALAIVFQFAALVAQRRIARGEGRHRS